MKAVLAASAVGAIALFGAPIPTHAAMMDGTTLLSACTQVSGSPQRSICLGYIAAMADAMAEAGVGDRKACFASDAKLSQMRDAVVAYLQKQQAAGDKAGSDAVAVALANQFPCR